MVECCCDWIIGQTYEVIEIGIRNRAVTSRSPGGQKKPGFGHNYSTLNNTKKERKLYFSKPLLMFSNSPSCNLFYKALVEYVDALFILSSLKSKLPRNRQANITKISC